MPVIAAAAIDEHAGDADFDGENGAASVRDCEADVDRRDHRKPERVDSRCVEPPEGKRCGRLCDADDQAPEGRRPPSCANRIRNRGRAHEAFGVVCRRRRLGGSDPR